MAKQSVAILMSVYNPNISYFKQQLSSIMEQDCDVSLVKVFIRDDGSTKSSVAALKPVIDDLDLVISIEYGNNLGPADSFRHLILNSELRDFDYVAFADQDDVWEQNKLSFIIDNMASHDQIPTLFYSNASLIDSDSQFIDGQLYSMMPNNETIFDVMMHSDIYGMAMVVNNKMLIQVQLAYPAFVTSHDHWIGIIAFAVGDVVYSQKKLVRYRQHGNNVVGAISNKPSYFKILLKHLGHLRRLLSLLFGDSQVRTIESAWILKYYKNYLHMQVIDDLYLLLNARKGMRYRVQLINNKSYRGRNRLATLAIYFRTLLGHV